MSHADRSDDVHRLFQLMDELRAMHSCSSSTDSIFIFLAALYDKQHSPMHYITQIERRLLPRNAILRTNRTEDHVVVPQYAHFVPNSFNPAIAADSERLGLQPMGRNVKGAMYNAGRREQTHPPSHLFGSLGLCHPTSAGVHDSNTQSDVGFGQARHPPGVDPRNAAVGPSTLCGAMTQGQHRIGTAVSLALPPDVSDNLLSSAVSRFNNVSSLGNSKCAHDASVRPEMYDEELQAGVDRYQNSNTSSKRFLTEAGVPAAEAVVAWTEVLHALSPSAGVGRVEHLVVSAEDFCRYARACKCLYYVKMCGL